jgi:iron complex outermembrane recepter protein
MKKIMGTTIVLLMYNLLLAQGSKKNAEAIPTNASDTGKTIAYFLTPLEVKAIRAAANAPFAKTNIDKTTITKQNLAQDLPFLLNQTPSVVINSDAGNGVGYTGIRIRGTDATRINVTLNGIPYNDAESMGTFFVNLPDFSSSVNSIQIQRGVGTSTNGSGAFGATINLSTNEFNDKSYVELNNSFGSFNTWKNTIKAGSGLIGKHFTIDARVSSIRSDGFIERAKSDLRSFYLSTAYTTEKSSLRFNIFSGKEKTYQAWYGVPENMLATNRRFNPAGTEKPGEPYDNQTDNYTQTHYQLFFNHQLSNKWALSTAAFLTRGYGYYEEYKKEQPYIVYGLPNVVVGSTTYTETDLVRQRWLDNYFYGQNLSLQFKDVKNELIIGGGWSTYQGDHFGKVIWLQRGTVPNNNKYYDVPALKKDANIFAKWTHKLTDRLSLFTDLQYRYVSHRMDGFANNPNLFINRQFNFFKPKAGISYQHNGWNAFLSYAVANKEPNRDDFQAGVNSQPTHETLQDIELGIEKRDAKYSLGATFYYMHYKNQLVLTGEINDVGAYTRINTPSSYRMGVELQGSAIVNKWFTASANFTISRNKIKSFVEYIDNYDLGIQEGVLHTNKDISFSPALVGSASLNFLPIQQLELSLLNKYVSKQYLDNTQNESRGLNGFFVQDLRAIYTLKKEGLKNTQIILQVNNVFNYMYEPNGYTFSYIYGGAFTTENYYYTMAGTNFMLALNIKL